MAIDTVAGLLDALRGSPILRPDQYDELVSRHAVDFPDPQDLARQLIKLKWITLYQAKKILAGKGSELVIGHYTVIDKLGEGGMGRVYKAVQQNLGRIVALKVVRSSLLKNEVALKRFRREVKAAAALSHPNIVRVFDADQDGDRHFLAMENIEGADLGRLVKDHGPLPVPVACSYIRQAALGLQHAHDQSIVHRDIKPGNLLVAVNDKGQYGPKNVVKILDMGLARSQAEEPPGEQISTELTRAGTVVGTPDYMSPEQAKNSSNVDARSDLYALGCTFFYLLTGEVVFPKGNPLEKLLQHQLDAPRPIQLLRLDLPPEVASIIQCLLAKKPEQRFQSGSAVANALEPWCVAKVQTAFTPSVAMAAEAVDPSPVSSETVRTVSPFNFDDDDPADPTPALPARETKAAFRTSPAENAKPSPATQKKRTVPLLVVVGGAFVATVIAIVGLMVLREVLASKPKPSQAAETTPKPEAIPKTREEPKTKEEPKAKEDPKTSGYQDSLDKFVPDDTMMALVFDIKNLSANNLARQHAGAPLQARFAPVKQLIKIDLFQIVERVIVAFPSDKSRSPMVILQGQSLAGKQLPDAVRKIPGVAVEKLADSGIEIVHFKPGKDDPADSKGTFAMLSGTSVLISESRERILEALEKREGARRTKFADPSMEAGLNSIYRHPFVATAVFGMRGPLAELTPAASKDIRYFVAGLGFEEKGMHFYTMADESENGRALEFQKALGKYFHASGRKPGEEDERLDKLGDLFAEARPGPLGPLKLKTFNTHQLIRPALIDDLLRPFLEDKPKS